jgi:NAD(P)-dependent dehydrogenase (short-subunit alcohol dehydrogenase family)
VKPGTIAVLGGYGTFGARVSRDLAERGHRVVVAGRDRRRAETLARALGSEHTWVAADVRDLAACRQAIRGAAVAVVCAGPFSALGPGPASAALAERAHYVDIADDRGYIRGLRDLDAGFARAHLCAAYGCSSLPAVSSALASSLVRADDRPARARVTLYIGAANPKGEASVRAMVERLGRAVRTPGGTRPGFGDPQTVPLPPPFGPRTAYTFDGPEHDLFPALLGVPAVDVRVGFELPLANAGFALLARTGAHWGRRTAAVLGRLATFAPAIGTSGGAVMVELEWSDGRRASRALVATEGGQRMAALPCAVVAHALATGAASAVGVCPPTKVVGAAELLGALEAAGMRLVDA